MLEFKKERLPQICLDLTILNTFYGNKMKWLPICLWLFFQLFGLAYFILLLQTHFAKPRESSNAGKVGRKERRMASIKVNGLSCSGDGSKRTSTGTYDH